MPERFCIDMFSELKDEIININEIPSIEISDKSVLEINPLVSVKMITYNHAPYISQAIEGVLMQKTNFPFELVIGEDCSTDGTREIVLDYQKRYSNIIRIITSEKNVGAKRNSLRAIKACRGKYIAFCEGDDYWHHPNKLQKQINYLEKNPKCGLVLCDCDIHDVKSNKIIKNINYQKGFKSQLNLTIDYLVGDWELIKWTCGALARKDLIISLIEKDSYLYLNENFLMGDLQLWAEIASISEVTYFPESLATYRVLTESASRSKDIKKTLEFILSGLEIRMYLCDKHKLPSFIREKIEFFWCDYALKLAFYKKDGKLGEKVKHRKKKFNLNEQIMYLGTKYYLINLIYRLINFLYNSIIISVKYTYEIFFSVIINYKKILTAFNFKFKICKNIFKN